MKFINSIIEAIGNTPLLKLNRVTPKDSANVFVKLEHLNPSGSYKDRMAISMIDAAEKGLTWNRKKLPKDGIVVEASAGNTAPALAMVCAAKGYKARFVLYSYSVEDDRNPRMALTRAFGPDVSISNLPNVYMSEEEAQNLLERDHDITHVITAKKDCSVMEETEPKSVWVDQITNKYNFIGQKIMAQEIYEQLDGKIDAIGCSVGAGGTLFGLCSGLAELGVIPKITFGVVPEGSENYIELDQDEVDRSGFRVKEITFEIAKKLGLSKWATEPLIVQEMIDAGYPDLFFRVYHSEARHMANRLCQEEGIYCGMSSGANVLIALRIAQRLGKGHNIVTTIVDRRDRYINETPNEKYVV
ncbi:MAG: pyridoxal-phosphate dependent enzyme [Chloroflexi bacterium]|nr:pyridoxal-phosphate dependent enzyme [Chloroflexota bacterium]